MSSEAQAIKARSRSPGKSKAQLQREKRQAESEEARASKDKSQSPGKSNFAEEDASSARPKREKKEKGENKSKAMLQREQRELQKAEEERESAEAATKAEVDAENQVTKSQDARSTVQKRRDEREANQDSLLKGIVSSASSVVSGAADIANSKTKAKSGSDTKEGLELFEELSNEEDPVDVAEWFLSQMKKVGRSEKGVEKLPIYKLACASNSATHGQRVALAKAAIAGYGAMEPEKRVEVLTMVVQSAPAVQSSKSSASTQHLANFQTVVKAARFDKMEEEQKTALLQATQAEALQYAGPEHLMDGLSHLGDEERKQLSKALVRAKLIPPEQENMIEEIIQPDGVLGEARVASRTVAEARDFIWLIILLPVLEWMCAKRWLKDRKDCADGLNSWLHVDACLSLASVLLALMAYMFLTPAYDVLCTDPVGSMRRWQKSAAAGEELSERLPDTFRIDKLSYQLGIGSVVLLLVLTLIGGCYATWGVVLLLGSLSDLCIETSVIFEAIVLSLRFGFIAWVVYMAFRVWDLMRRHRLLNSGNAAEPGYGSTQDDFV